MAKQINHNKFLFMHFDGANISNIVKHIDCPFLPDEIIFNSTNVTFPANSTNNYLLTCTGIGELGFFNDKLAGITMNQSPVRFIVTKNQSIQGDYTFVLSKVANDGSLTTNDITCSVSTHIEFIQYIDK